jgi:hypothetical protein
MLREIGYRLSDMAPITFLVIIFIFMIVLIAFLVKLMNDIKWRGKIYDHMDVTIKKEIDQRDFLISRQRSRIKELEKVIDELVAMVKGAMLMQNKSIEILMGVKKHVFGHTEIGKEIEGKETKSRTS